MDETKERLKQLIDFFTGHYLVSLNQTLTPTTSSNLSSFEPFDSNFKTYIDDASSPSNQPQQLQDDEANSSQTQLSTRTDSIKISPISRQDIEIIIKTLELCKKNMTHFSTNERLYLMPLMTLCGNVLLTETHLISRAYLSLVSEILVYILQFLLGEISLYNEDESNYDEFNPVFLQQLKDVKLFSYDSEEYYRHFLKYRLIKFLNFMLLDDDKYLSDGCLTYQDLISLCQMLRMKPLPDTLRLHTMNFEDELSAKTTSNLTALSSQPSAKRIRLTNSGLLERNSKEEFFDQLLTPFIFSTNIPAAAADSSSEKNILSTSKIQMKNISVTAAAAASTAPLNLRPLTTVPISSNITNVAAISTKIQSTQQIRSYLISQNQMYFQYIGGATSILNLINNYTLLRPYVLHLLAIEEGANLRLVRLDGSYFDLVCDCIAADIDLVNNVFALNRLLEPLSCDRTSKMIVIVQACLNACLTLISHASVYYDSAELTKSEKSTLDIIDKSLSLYNKVFDVFRQSNRVAGQISQNAHMFTAWLLFSGLQMILNSKQGKGERQGYNFLCIPLAKHALKLMSYLLDDLHLEFGDQNNILEDVEEGHNIQELNFFKKFSFNLPSHCSGQSVTTTPNPTPAELSPSSSRTSIPSSTTGSSGSAMPPPPTNNIRAINTTFKYNKFGHYSAWQRIDMIVSSNLNVIHLLFSYLSAGYRRATLLRHSTKLIIDDGNTSSNSGNEESFDQDDELPTKQIVEFKKQNNESNNVYEDIHMSNFLIFETFNEQLNKLQNGEKRTLDLEHDIDNHYELVISILDHMNYYYVCSKIDALRSYFKQMLTDAQLIVLAHIIQDLDSEMDNVQALSPLSSKTFGRFSSSLTSLMHNLIAMQILSDEQQNSLLAYLGFKPTLESECSWPLHHDVRSLAILAQIILLRQQKEQEDIKLDLNSTTIQIWRGFINKLKHEALSFKGEVAFFNSECPDFQEDLNVEHAQLMLFLFHNLKLLQRKHVFSLVGLALNEISVKLNTNKCSISAAQILFIGRMLHLFEYMCKNLYDTPAYLFEQINHNLLNLIMNREYQAPPSYKEDLSKFNMEDWEKIPDSFRNIKFFVDKKLELNFLTYLVSNFKSSSKKTYKCNHRPNLGNFNNINLSLNFFDLIVHPRFYHLMDVSIPISKSTLLRNFKPKLDGIACNFMLAGFSSLTYDQFYNSLLNLCELLAYQYDFDPRSPSSDEDTTEIIRYPQFGPFGLCAMDYTFATMWRLLNQLPPSLQFLQDIVNMVESSIENDQNFVSIDASRILNMCIWMPRFENNRSVCCWVAELLSKVGNQNESNSLNKQPSVEIEKMICVLSKKISSLEFNYHLFQCIAWPFFRYRHSNNLNLSSTKNLLFTTQKQLLPLQYYQFPKFFTIFTIDIYLERIISLFNDELKSSKKSSTDSVQINQELIENYLNLFLGLFDKIHNEITAVLLYDGPLSTAGRNDCADMNYLFYRSMVNICSTNSFETNISEISSNIMDYLPQSIVSKIDQWNRIYVNVDRNVTETELPNLFQKGILFDIPLIELPQNSIVGSTSSSSRQSNNLYHFSAFINEKYTIIDTPSVNSIDTGYANMTWTKLKQFLIKLFKFIDLIYSKRDLQIQNDPFVTCYMLQLNLVSNTYFFKLNETHNQLSGQLNKLFDLKSDCIEAYCSILYPYFIGNAFFIMTVFNHPLFPELKENDIEKFQKIFQVCSLEFCKFFSKILKRRVGILAFEEFFCEESPFTPNSISGQQPVICTKYSLMNLIEVCSHPLITSNYAINIMKMIKTIMSQSEKYPEDISLIRLCSELSSALAEHEDRITLLYNWFNLVLFNRTGPNEELIVFGSTVTKTTDPKFYLDDTSNANLYLFFKFICYVIKGTSRFDEIVLASMAEAIIINAQTLITEAFIQSSNVFLYFSGLFTSLVYLMSATGNSDSHGVPGKPSSHFRLIQEVIHWLSWCRDYLSNKDMLKRLEHSVINEKQKFLMESCYQMLSYLSDIFSAMEYKFVYLRNRKESNLDDGSKVKDDKKETKSVNHRIFIDDECEDDTVSNIESDDDIEDAVEEDLGNQLCTFTQTKKDFANQHWYHCHTCKMLNGVGVCTICAKVCHRHHDVTYSKYGSFFCDCGANKDGICKALVKRQSQTTNSENKVKKRNQIKLNGETKKTIYDKKRSMRISKYWYTSSYSLDSYHSKLSDNFKMSKNKFSNQMIYSNYDRFGLQYEQLETFSNLVMSFITPLSDTVISLIEYFVPILENFFQSDSELGFLSKVRKEYSVLHNRNIPLSIEKCEQLMVVVKSWHDPLFENVQISNEQSHPVRHLTLITGAVVRRVAMLVLGSSTSLNRPPTYPCLLAVTHDKNHLSIVQLNHLLGQVYSNSRKKLNPQKIATLSLPFTIMTMSKNLLNDELLAVCGLKECHVLTLAKNGTITGHYPLTLSFDVNNHITKTCWLPDAQTELAVVTLDFIKIFDLSKEDRDKPIYNFVIPSRKIRDMTFFSFEESGKLKRFILIFSSRGHIYAQELNADSQCSNANDIFYVTSIFNVTYPDSWLPSCQQTLVGFSIYYSHLLQMLFVSYLNGSSFCASFSINNIYMQQIVNVTSLDLYSVPTNVQPASSSTSQSQDLFSSNITTANSNSQLQPQPLFQWTEVLTHPGLIFALTMNTNNPVCFMVKSTSIKVQELRPKKKVIDFVAVSTIPNNSISNNLSLDNTYHSRVTTLISLCDDGSLRFHRATSEYTDFWLKPHLYNLDEIPTYCNNIAKSPKSNQIEQTNSLQTSLTSKKNPRFAVDFFERCNLMNTIEFGGSDVLEVYNTQQIKNRLNSTNMYIACTKPYGFDITVTQNGTFDQVMAGIRVNLGVCDPARAPTGIEIFGRTIFVAINRHRWFDIPFTRSEIKKLAETNTFNIHFSPSGDPNHVTIVDSIRVYGRLRESIINEEETVLTATISNNSNNSNNSNSNNTNNTNTNNTNANANVNTNTNTNTTTNTTNNNGPVSTTGTTQFALEAIRHKLASISHSSSSLSIKSPIQKLRSLLYAPTITDDELITTFDSKSQAVFVLNRLLSNSLDVLEALLSFSKSISELSIDQQTRPSILLIITARDLMNASEYKQKCDTALSISSKLLTISLSSRLDKSICMLMAKLLSNKIQYDEHRGEIIFENAIENLKQRAYDDINVFCYNLLLFRETVTEHPRNFIRYIGKYFTQCSDVYASTVHFCTYLMDLFWRLYSQRPINELISSIIKISKCSNIELIVDSLVFILYSSTYAVLSNTSDLTHHENQQKIIGKASQLIIQMICSPDLQISHSAKKTLWKILHSITSGIYPHLEKPSNTKIFSSSKLNVSTKSGQCRERKHSEKEKQPSTTIDQAISTTRPVASTSHTEPSTSGNSTAENLLRRQGATRRTRSSGASSVATFWANRHDSSGPNQSSGRSSFISPGSASLLERVTESILDNDFDPYHNLLLNIDSDFPYFQDLMANFRREHEQEEVYESITGEDDEEDDDDDDDDELDMPSIRSQPSGNSNSAPPPLFPMNSYSAEANSNAQQPPLEEVLDEDAREDEDDEEHDEEEDDDDDFEAMDEDEMMEIAIALSLQEQQREQRVIEVDYNDETVERTRSAQSNRTIEEIVEDFRTPRNEPPNIESEPTESQLPVSSQSEPQQSHYSVLHSESDDDDEELFDDEIKLADTTMESIEAEEEHEDYEDDEELNSVEAATSFNLKTSKSISKSIETISKRSTYQPMGQNLHHHHHHHHHLHHHLHHFTDIQNERFLSSKNQKEAQKNRKRLRELVASKFCLALLKQMNNSWEIFIKLNGIQAIPFLQVLNILTDYNYSESDQKEFNIVLNQIIKKMFDYLLKSDNEQTATTGSGEITESPAHMSKLSRKMLCTHYKDRIEGKLENEIQLLTMRLFSIFLSNFKRFQSITWQTFLSKDLPINELLRANILQSGKIVGTQESEESNKTTVTSTSSSVSLKSSSASQNSLLLITAQLIHSNVSILDYCFAMLHSLLKNYWRQLNVVEAEDSEKNKFLNSVDKPIEYNSKKPIKIRRYMKFIPLDLRPFFTLSSEIVPVSNLNSITFNQNGTQDTSGVCIINNTTNSSCNLSNSCTTINSVVFSNHVFDHYPELLTEMSLRIPYQLKKLINFLNNQTKNDETNQLKQTSPFNYDFDALWIETLCEYMMSPTVTPYIRKQVRKLLNNLCGSKERYRQGRDYYAIKTNLRAVRRLIVMNFFDSNSSNCDFKLQDIGMCEEDMEDEEQLDEFIRIIVGKVIQNDDKTSKMLMSSDQHRLLNLPYSQLINLVDHLKACLDIASTRVHNWQRLCRREIRIVPFLFRISFLFGEGISSIILQLLSLALFSDIKNPNRKPEENNLTNNLIINAEQTKSNEASKTEKSVYSNHQSFICCYVFIVLDNQLMSYFIRFFLLESNSTQQRWATHSLLYMFFESLQPPQQEQFLSLFWQLWPHIASYGKRASQFVDLLGYFTLTISKCSNINEIQNNASPRMGITENERLYAYSAISLLRFQNQLLIKHPNANIYNSLQSLLELNGYYLETEPCFVCNNPEINFTPVKLSSIKMDSRFTTNTQIVKLIGAHTISRISVKVSELKKSKLVKTLCIYYNNRWVQSVVELKNKNTIWHKAKRINLAPSQSDIKIDFTLPIIACNLMIEYTSFYEAAHSSTETLQCPRCSSVVLANPGVCTNCGENVFQCHKCRAINYDEKDPFLCNSCGFCKYAKFDFILTARYTASAVEAIENEEDRAKAVQTINSLLDKADRLYKIILSIRPTLENMLLVSQDYHSTLQNNETIDTTSNSNAISVTSGVGSSNSMTSTTLNGTSSSVSSLNVNRYIYQLASRYSNDCRVHFEELSKIVQKILYTRKELVDYDNRQNDNRHNMEDIKRLLQEHRHDFIKMSYGGSTTSLSSTSSSTLVDISSSTSAAKKQCKQSLGLDEFYQGIETKKKKLSNDEELIRYDFKSGHCYGCASATIEHCIILLKALVHNPRYKTLLSSSNLFRELIDYNLRIGTSSFRNKVRSLLCLLIRDDLETTEEFNNLLLEKIGLVLQTRYMTSFDFGSIRHEMSLLSSSFENEDNCWEQRLRCVMKLFLLSLQNKSPAVLEAITLPCLRILYGLIIKPSPEKSETKQSTNTVEQLASVQLSNFSQNLEKQTQIPLETLMVNVSVDLNQWLVADNRASFSSWQQRNMKISKKSECTSDPVKLAQFEEYLQRKYFSRWHYLYQSGKIRSLKLECFIIHIASSTWIQEVLFNPTSKALRIACRKLLMALFERLSSKQRILIDLFTSFLDDLCQVGGEIGLEFYDLYRSIVFNEFRASSKAKNIVKHCHWRYYLTCCGLLQHLGQLISTEIDRLKQLEESTLSSDFSQGSALRQLVELMQLFLRDERIRRMHKSSMVAFVLDGYLSLRKLIVQRTKMIDETQAALLELLELLTTGTKNETINFMKVCIESVKKCSLQDFRTPVFIFERLCSIIYPEEKDADEFFISLEKDPQQEDFLQGRMLGNPYSSKDSGMGPLMRDIKNKICQECELVSLLEDDSGLELLVNNKIISLDLPVKEVYKKIVCADAQASHLQQPSLMSASSWASGNSNFPSEIAIIDSITGNIFPVSSSTNPNNNINTANSGPTMKITYRIRGLMGDATEEFIETLCNKELIVKDDEKLFELANQMSKSNGLQVMLERLQAINEINNRSRNLLFVLLKLFGYCVRVISNRRAMIKPELNAISIMLRIVGLFLKNPQVELLTTPSSPGEPSYFEQLLIIMETLLMEASKEEPEIFDRFNKETCGNSEDVQLLINAVSSPDSIIFSANVASLNNRILRVVTFLSIGQMEKMTTLINNFRPYFEFDDYDTQNMQMENPDHWYELFCSLVTAIEPNHNGARLKDRMIDEGFISLAINYMVRNAPPMKSFVLLNSEEWKEFTSRPALKYVLKMLTGMSHGHEPTQMLITKEGVPIIHALEQVLSDSHMATLAENLMDALKENPSVEAKIEEIRLKTREEKKRIAMAVREKQLGELGMKANDKGQVMADSELLKKMEGELKEEKGLICSICREGYSYQPQKVLAIYTFTKRCNVEEFEERKTRKTIGYTTVTHFNIVHVECHMDAVRHARTRDEWQSASLHNANTRCNGLLPLWGPNIYESLFAHALSRHNSYLQEVVGQRNFVGTNSFLGTVHDLKLLLLRFANEKSFSEETGGGGAQSNLYLTPYLMHTALYVMNTTKVTDRERSSFEENFMQQTSSKLIESCFQVESAFFYSTMVILLYSQKFWQTHRLYFLRRLILCTIIRNIPADSRNIETISNTKISYDIIKPALMFFALINLFYTIMFKSVEVKPDSDWSQALVDYIRHNDQLLLESADKMLDTFENDILLSTSFDEFCDASDLYRGNNAISDQEQFLEDTLKLS